MAHLFSKLKSAISYHSLGILGKIQCEWRDGKDVGSAKNHVGPRSENACIELCLMGKNLLHCGEFLLLTSGEFL